MVYRNVFDDILRSAGIVEYWLLLSVINKYCGSLHLVEWTNFVDFYKYFCALHRKRLVQSTKIF